MAGSRKFKGDRQFDHAAWSYGKPDGIPTLTIDFTTEKSLPSSDREPPANVRATKAYIFFKRTLGEMDDLGNKVARVPAETPEKPREAIEQVQIVGAGHIIKLARWLNTYDKDANQPYLDLIPDDIKRKAGIELSARRRRLNQPPQLEAQAAVAMPEPEAVTPMYTRQLRFSGDPQWVKSRVSQNPQEPKGTQLGFTGDAQWGKESFEGKERTRRAPTQDEKKGQGR